MDELLQKFRSLEATTLRFILSHYSIKENVVMISSLLRFPPEKVAMEPEVKVKGNGVSGSSGLGEKTFALVAKEHVGTKLAARKRNSTKGPMKKRKAEKKLGKLSIREPGRQRA
uniref:40S ribosomal protein S30 n=1 Tax=Angiostrongylus cantonensis TaxID=6313 RepID=A0A0K0CYL7_ANGCA